MTRVADGTTSNLRKHLIKSLSVPDLPGQVLVNLLCAEMQKYFFAPPGKDASGKECHYSTPQLKIDSVLLPSLPDHTPT